MGQTGIASSCFRHYRCEHVLLNLLSKLKRKSFLPCLLFNSPSPSGEAPLAVLGTICISWTVHPVYGLYIKCLPACGKYDNEKHFLPESEHNQLLRTVKAEYRSWPVRLSPWLEILRSLCHWNPHSCQPGWSYFLHVFHSRCCCTAQCFWTLPVGCPESGTTYCEPVWHTNKRFSNCISCKCL